MVVINSASGMRVTDHRGREFLDAGGGLWCMNVGYGRQAIADVAAAQMAKLPYFHSFGLFSNEPLIRLADRLLKLAPPGMTRAIFCSSGSEANDTQIKIVRRYNNLLGRPAKKKIIARHCSYHGSTVAAASLSGLPMMHETFDLPIPGILHTLSTDYHRRPGRYQDSGAVHAVPRGQADPTDRGRGPAHDRGLHRGADNRYRRRSRATAGYFREVQRVLDHYDILMIADEVITGFGRTGSWFASPALELRPDLISIAKGSDERLLPDVRMPLVG